MKILIDDIGDGSIERAQKLLAAIPHGADKAVGSALKRAATSGMAHASKAIRKEYVVNAGIINRYTRRKLHFISSGGMTTVDMIFQGEHIPLIRFDTKISGDGRVSARVKRTSARTALDHVFGANVGGHHGVFERETSKRFPIEEKFGPSVPQMIDANDDVSQALGDKIREVFEERLDHEILAVMNGWRG